MGIKGRENVTVIRNVDDEEIDDFGNPVYSISEIDFTNCLIAWGSSSINETLYQTREDTEAVIQFPKNSDIFHTDRFIIRGEKYECNGSPTVWIPQAGSTLKTKVLVEVKHVEG